MKASKNKKNPVMKASELSSLVGSIIIYLSFGKAATRGSENSQKKQLRFVSSPVKAADCQTKKKAYAIAKLPRSALSASVRGAKLGSDPKHLDIRG